MGVANDFAVTRENPEGTLDLERGSQKTLMARAAKGWTREYLGRESRGAPVDKDIFEHELILDAHLRISVRTKTFCRMTAVGACPDWRILYRPQEARPACTCRFQDRTRAH